jgi:hypothetical protein
MTTPELIIPAASGLAGVLLGFLGTWFISERQRITAFRMAGLDKRLEAHQEAYRLWNNMIRALDRTKEERGKAVEECDQWWINHCLYLDARSRKEFIDCVKQQGIYEALNRDYSLAEKKELHNRILNVLKLLEEGVHLPPLGRIEKPPV